MTALNPTVVAGTSRMLALRERVLADGATHLGWKLGLGAPAALERFGLDRPLVGFLVDRGLVADGETVALTGWTAPVLEAEIAVHLGAPLGQGASAEEGRAAIAAWSVAIELADLAPPPTDIGEVLAGNVFHRHVVLGERVSPLSAPPPFVVRRDGEPQAGTDDPAALTGELGALVAGTADTLAACGAGGLAAGDVLITGSVVPPIAVGPGHWVVEADGLGTVSVRLD